MNFVRFAINYPTLVGLMAQVTKVTFFDVTLVTLSNLSIYGRLECGTTT